MVLTMLLSLLIHIIVSLETAAHLTCSQEFKKITLIWPEKSTNITQNVEARFWHKDVNLVSVINERGFTEGNSYKGRLNHIGDGNIEIKNATRNDSGNYQVTSKFQGVSNTSTESVSLQVIDAPAGDCKPMISHEGSNLKANLPSVGVCSWLTLEWIGTNKSVTTQNGTTILNLGTDSGEREFMVCAVGEAVKCFRGNISDFCTNYTVPQHQQSGDGETLHPAAVAILTILIVGSIGVAIVLLLRNKGFICKKSSQKMDEEQRLGHPLIPKSDLSKTRYHLQNHYGTMTDTSMSPVGERNVSLSEVYISMNLESLRIETRVTDPDLPGATPCDVLISKEDTVNLMTQNKLLPQFIMIIGDRGSGKSSLCKHLTRCWSLKSEMGDKVMQGLNLPRLTNFQLLLYLPLKNSDEGLSFKEILQQSLFPTQQSCLEFVSNHMNGQNLSQSILIIIDGLDKISKDSRLKLISKLLVSELSSCTYIFTSRPISFNQISDACIDRAMKLYKICEMTPEKSTIYVNSVLDIINQHNNMTLNEVHFLTFTKYLHVKCLLTSPYLCLSLLHVWMENKNPNIQMKDIIVSILENLHNHDRYFKCSNQKLHKRLKLFVNRFFHKPTNMKCFVDSFSEIAVEVFIYEINTLRGVEDQCHENIIHESTMLEAASELGLITEAPSLDSTENKPKLTFTNKQIYHFLVANSIVLKKGPAFDYIVSCLTVALENYMIINMICQFSPTRGKEIFDKLSKNKEKSNERHNELNKKYLIKRTRKRQSAKGLEVSVCWLQNLMYESKLDDQILLFVTDALTFTDSLSVLELKNLENSEDIIFWLPFSAALKVLKLNISKCTLLLCPEWKNAEPINLKEVIIRSLSIDKSTRCLLVKVLDTCSHQLTKRILPPASASFTNINEILLPR